jgi:hypothetical protein
MAYIGAWAGIISGIWLLFEKAEETLRPETRTAISNWLKNSNLGGELANWPTAFVSVFDSIFGKKHLSWRCFFRSSIASFAAVTIVFMFFFTINPEPILVAFKEFVDMPRGILLMLLPVAITVVLNPIPDYISLLETRYIINRMSKTNSSIKIMGYLVFDFIATFVIFSVVGMFMSFLVLFILTGGSVVEASEGIAIVLEVVKTGIFLGQNDSSSLVGIWLYSTFFTSVWVYLYILSGMIVKVGSFIGILGRLIRKIFDIDNRPLRSMGYVCMVLVSLIFLIAPFVKLLF